MRRNFVQYRHDSYVADGIEIETCPIVRAVRNPRVNNYQPQRAEGAHPAYVTAGRVGPSRPPTGTAQEKWFWPTFRDRF